MRVTLVLALVLCAAGWPRESAAEKVHANQTAKLLARPGEHAPMIVKIKSGQVMTVLAKEGRWIKVRVSGRTGYVPRSKVDLPEGDDEIARNTRRRPFVDGRGTKRGFGGEGGPEDRVGADATGEGAGKGEDEADEEAEPEKPAPKATKPKPKAHEEDEEEKPKPTKKPPKAKPEEEEETPEKDEKEQVDDRPRARVSAKTTIYEDASKESGEAFVASKKTVLIVGEKKGKYTFVETDEGDAGYVLSSKLDVDDGDSGVPTKRVIALRARTGISYIQQAFRMPSDVNPKTPPDNYNVNSPTFTLAIGASYLQPVKNTSFLIGGEFTYDYDKAFSGITYAGQTTGFTLHNFNLRATGGYDLHKRNGMMIFARLGFHYESFQVANVTDLMKNNATLPSEIIKAPAFGAALAIPRLTDKIGGRISLDLVPLGSVEQTKNLEDGTAPSVTGVMLGIGATYRWKPQIDLQATYDLDYNSVSFAGMPPATSQRMHLGTGLASRTDIYHTISVGVGYAF